jgi:hypothetical protein
MMHFSKKAHKKMLDAFFGDRRKRNRYELRNLKQIRKLRNAIKERDEAWI